MNNKENLLKFLIPVVAIVIVLESVILISGMTRKSQITTEKREKTLETTEATPTVVAKKPVTMAEAAVTMAWVAKTSMKVKAVQPVELKMAAKKDIKADAVDLYIKYDPKLVTISGLTFDKKLPTPTVKKISEDKGMVVVNFWVTDPEGLQMKTGEEITLAKFNMKALMSGSTELVVNTGDVNGGSTTMVVENGTSKVLPFYSDKLRVSILE